MMLPTPIRCLGQGCRGGTRLFAALSNNRPTAATSGWGDQRQRFENALRSSFCERHVYEPSEPVRSGREPDGDIITPGLSGLGVGDDELTVALKSLDASPLV